MNGNYLMDEARNLDIIDRLLEHLWLQERLSQNTLDGYRRDLVKIAAVLDGQGKTWLNAVQDDLAAAVFDGELGMRSQARALSACRRLYGWLSESGQSDDNPVQHLKSPKAAKTLPDIITEAQIDALLAAPDTETPHGLRDKALLELMYATGLRVSEAVNLALHEIHLGSGLVNTVGKGGKQRIVPLGEEAVYWLECYLNGARSVLLKAGKTDKVFVGQKQCGITRQLAWQVVKHYALTAGIRHLSPHGLRHAFATHLVNHGADLRVVQMLLGHTDISTTQIYTHVANHRLQSLVAQHHPRGK